MDKLAKYNKLVQKLADLKVQARALEFLFEEDDIKNTMENLQLQKEDLFLVFSNKFKQYLLLQEIEDLLEVNLPVLLLIANEYPDQQVKAFENNKFLKKKKLDLLRPKLKEDMVRAKEAIIQANLIDKIRPEFLDVNNYDTALLQASAIAFCLENNAGLEAFCEKHHLKPEEIGYFAARFDTFANHRNSEEMIKDILGWKKKRLEENSMKYPVLNKALYGLSIKLLDDMKKAESMFQQHSRENFADLLWPVNYLGPDILDLDQPTIKNRNDFGEG